MNDKQLLKRVAEFAGWTWMDSSSGILLGIRPGKNSAERVPDYLNSLDAFHRDVWPVIERSGELAVLWWNVLADSHSPIRDAVNATARDRCFALAVALGWDKDPEKPCADIVDLIEGYFAGDRTTCHEHDAMLTQAADEINRLRAEVTAYRERVRNQLLDFKEHVDSSFKWLNLEEPPCTKTQ